MSQDILNNKCTLNNVHAHYDLTIFITSGEDVFEYTLEQIRFRCRPGERNNFMALLQNSDDGSQTLVDGYILFENNCRSILFKITSPQDISPVPNELLIGLIPNNQAESNTEAAIQIEQLCRNIRGKPGVISTRFNFDVLADFNNIIKAQGSINITISS